MDITFEELVNQDQSQFFCYLYTRSANLAYFGIGQIFVGSVMLSYTLFLFMRTIKMDLLSNNLKFIYAAIFAQCLLFLGKMIFSEVVYWTNHNQDHEDDATDQQFKQLSIYSKYVLMVDILESFTVQGLLIRVCYNWMQKIVELLEKICEFEDQFQSKATLKMIRFEKNCQKALGVYLLARFLLYIVLLLLLFIETTPSKNVESISFFFLMIQSIFTPMIIGLGIYAIKRNKKIIQIVDEAQIKVIINQYSILLLCTAARFGFNVWKTIQELKSEMSNPCTMDTQFEQDRLPLAISLYIVQDILYFLPAWIVLRIFNVKNANQMSNSLLQSDRLHENQPVDTIQILDN